MKLSKKGLIFFVILILSIIIVVKMTLPPSPVSENAPSTEFSAFRAFKHIEAIAKEPRITGSEAAKKAREYVISELNQLGIYVQIEKKIGLENVYAIIEGTDSSDAIMLTAHLDTVYNSPGAADDGSGVAVLLETARALRSNPPYKNTIILLFTDGEEQYVRGSREFIRSSSVMESVKIVLGFDAGGLSGPSLLTSTSDNNSWLISQLAKAYPQLLGSSGVSRTSNSQTDFTLAFRPAGYSGYEFDLILDKRIHSRDDNIKNLNIKSIQDQGNQALAMADHFGNLDSLDDPGEKNVIYFSFLRLFVVRYEVVFGYILAIGLICLYIILLIMGKKNKLLTLPGILYGAFVCLLGLGLIFILSLLLNKLIKIDLFMSLSKSLAGYYQAITFIIITLAFVSFMHVISQKIRRTSLQDMTMGTLLPILITMMVVSIIIPDISYVLSWPLLFSLLACMNWFYIYRKKRNNIRTILGFLFSGIATILLLGPYIFIGLFSDISISLVLNGLFCLYLIPYIITMLGWDNTNYFI